MRGVYFTPRIFVPCEDLVGLIVDRRDRRFGQILGVANTWIDTDQGIRYITHLCPDGTIYSSKHLHYSRQRLAFISKDEFDVDPPTLYLRDMGLISQDMLQLIRGSTLWGLVEDFRAIGGELRDLFEQYRTLFGDCRDLEQIRTAPEVTAPSALELAA